MFHILRTTLVYTLLQTVTANESDSLPRSWNASWTVIEEAPNYDRRFISQNIFAREKGHSIAYITWNDYRNTYPTTYNLTVQTHTFDGKTFEKTCSISPPPINGNFNESSSVFLSHILILKEDKILIFWRDDSEEWNRVHHVLSTGNCQSSDYIHTRSSDPSIARYQNSFDLISRDKNADHMSKRSFDYDGKSFDSVLTDLSVMNTKVTDIRDIYSINYDSGEGIVISGRSKIANSTNEDESAVYSPLTGWTKIENDGLIHWYSNSSGFATFCWTNPSYGGPSTLSCKWLDRTRGDLTIKIKLGYYITDKLITHNQPNGHILLVSWHFINVYGITVDEVLEGGGCKRVAQVREVSRYEKIEISRIDDDQYCLSYLQKERVEYHVRNRVALSDSYKYKFTMTCTKTLNDEKFLACGAELD